MFREMRRKDRQLTVEESIEILLKGETGYLSTISANGYPYTVPLNYIFFNDCIYFHCAKEGHKIDNIVECNKVSFCVARDIENLPEEFSTNYKSVILFGRAKEVIETEKSEALLEIIKKYSNQFVKKGIDHIEQAKGSTSVFKINIEHMTGKARK